MTKLLRKSNFIWLTSSLAAMMFLRALTDEIPGIYTFYIIEYVNILLFLVALESLRGERSWYRSLVAVIVVLLLIAVVQHTTKLKHLDIASLILSISFFILVMHVVGRQVLMTGSVNVHKIVGAIALYLLLGLIWAAWYGIVLQFSPGAIKGIEYVNWQESAADITYFSFVTLTSLGYGDMSPVTPIAKVVVILEAITGILFLAIVVASLVGAMRRND